jgi:RsiW-degrading membrane proteinase PrsW (M82 family)
MGAPAAGGYLPGYVPGIGAPTPAVPAPPQRIDRRRVLTLAGVAAGFLICGTVLLLIIGYDIGPVALVVGLAAAALPVPFLVAAFMWLDRYEPEPTWALVCAFVWGACVAALAALGANTGVAATFNHVHWPIDAVAVGVAPVVEESVKALGPVLLLIITARRGRPLFNGVTDAIVFFGMSATGFAMSENILYLGGYGYAMGADKAGVEGGFTGVIQVFIGRIPLSGFAHPLFTSMTAVGVGIAIRATNRRVKIIAPILGLLTAIVLHGSWNLMATLANRTGRPEILLYGYFAVAMPIFFAVVALAMWLRSSEGRLTQTALVPYVRAGWLSPPEVASLATVGRRRSARTWATRVAGSAGSNAMRGFQLAATRLALLRDRAERRVAAGGDTWRTDMAEEGQLLFLLSAYRAGYAGADPLAPPAFWDGSRYHVQFPDGVTRVIDPPVEPVVPVPVIAPPPPAYAFGAPGPGRPGAPPPGYGAPPGYGPPPGYGAPPGYGPPPGYGAPPGYGPPPGQPYR